jgi:cyclopropane fatty-acyl-phospholipid synthase-like methyltransferase
MSRTTLARDADLLRCYERAVQAPAVDAEFMDRTFQRLRARRAHVLREDFCGTAALCAAWIRRNPDHRAYGIDLCEKTLNWGIRTHLLPMGADAARVTLLKRDVRDAVDFKADVAAAFNFSYWTFKDRPTMRAYFEQVRDGLVDDGLFYLDLFGGARAAEVRMERKRFGDFTYIWDQHAFNPITHEIQCYIHFKFRDGSRIHRAFSYGWRIWHIPELEDIAREAGYRDFIVYWEGTDLETGEGNGVFRPSRKGDDAESFIAYLVCVK